MKDETTRLQLPSWSGFPKHSQWARFLLTCLLLVSGGSAWAQDAFRASLAGQAAAEARKGAARQRYNVKFGPVSLRLAQQLGIEATDNVRNAPSSDAESDLVLQPRFDVGMLWHATEKNSLNLNVGLGYNKYIRTSQYDSFYVSPNSDLSFDIYVSDFVINLHSRFAYTQDVSSDPTVSGTGSLTRFENTSGMLVTWDLNKLILTAGYDHSVYIPTENKSSNPERASELVSTSAALRIRPTIFAGLQAGAGMTSYQGDNQNQNQQDNQNLFAGPFVRYELNEYNSLSVAGGYVIYTFDGNGTNNLSDLNAFYFDITLRQQVGPKLAHTLSVGHQIQSGVYSSSSDEYYARYSANWRLFRKTGLNTFVSYQNISGEGGNNEKISYYSLGLTLTRPITRRTSGSLGYQFYLKDSDIEDNDYTQNRLVLTVRYVY